MKKPASRRWNGCEVHIAQREGETERDRERKQQKEMTMCRVKQLYNHRKPYISIIFTSCCITGVQNAKLINLHEKNVSDLSDLISHTHALGRNLATLENTDEKKNTKILKGENLRETEKGGFGEKAKTTEVKKRVKAGINVVYAIYKNQLPYVINQFKSKALYHTCFIHP